MTRDVSDVTHRKRGLRFEKSQLIEFCRRKKKVDFRLLAVALGRCRTWFGADVKVSIERWYLSPYVEKPLNLKVIKSFVPELRSRKCFCVTGFLCYIWIWVMNILCPFHTHPGIWLCYNWIQSRDHSGVMDGWQWRVLIAGLDDDCSKYHKDSWLLIVWVLLM